MDTNMKFKNYQTLPFFQITDQLTTIKNSENGFSVIIFFESLMSTVSAIDRHLYIIA